MDDPLSTSTGSYRAEKPKAARGGLGRLSKELGCWLQETVRIVHFLLRQLSQRKPLD